MDDRHHHRDERQRHHHEQERQVPEALALGHAHRHVPEHAGQGDQPEDRDDPSERTAHEDEQRHATDRIERDPLARESEAQQRPDERHRDPERAAAPPPARPDGREDHVGGHDEEADVDVVHPDPRLDEEHPIDQHEEPDQQRHEASPEEDPRQQVEAGGGQRAEDDPRQAPREGVRAELDRCHRPVAVEDEQLLPVAGRVVGGDVGGPRGRLETRRERRVGEDRVAVRLDDVDGPRTGRRRVDVLARRFRSEAQDVDHLAGLVVHDLRPGSRERMDALVDRPVRGLIAADDDDVVDRRARRSRRHEQLRVLQAGDLGQAVGAAVEPDRRDDPGTRRIDERDPVARRGGDPGNVLDLDARQAPVGDGGLDLLPRVTGARAAEDDRGAGPRQVRLVIGGVAGEELGEDGGLRRGIVDLFDGRDQCGAVAAVGEVHEAGQVHAPDDRAGREVERVEVLARPDHDRGPVLRDVQQVHGAGHVAEWLGGDAAGGRVRPDGVQVERGQASVVEADHELLATRIDGERADPGRRERRDQRRGNAGHRSGSPSPSPRAGARRRGRPEPSHRRGAARPPPPAPARPGRSSR